MAALLTRALIALVVALALAAGSSAPSANATDPVAIAVDANPGLAGVQASRIVGAVFAVDVVIASVSDLQAFNFEVVYDQAKLSTSGN